MAASYSTDAAARWTGSRDGSIAKAVAAGRQAVALDDADASIRVTFGVTLLLAGQFEQAIAEQERALELNPYREIEGSNR